MVLKGLTAVMLMPCFGAVTAFSVGISVFIDDLALTEYDPNMSDPIAKLLLEQGAVSLSPNNPFTYASGLKGPVYCDNRVLISDPKARTLITQAFVQLIGDRAMCCDVVAGTATAGIPWAAWVADALAKPMVYVRANAKEHGKKNQIEGRLLPGQAVVVVEDLVTTAGSSLNAVAALRSAGAMVDVMLSIFSYGLEASLKALRENHVTLRSLTCLETLVDEALAQTKITAEEKCLILEWQKDPESWKTNRIP